jgi:L-fuculose-phosphate aldolase
MRVVTTDELIAGARERVAAAGRRLAQEGLVLGSAGNVSARVGDRLAITPTGAILAELDAEQVVLVNLEGEGAAGDFAPTSELALHLGIYRRYVAGAVAHCHAPVATALSCVLDEVPVTHYQMQLLGGSVRVAPYRPSGSVELAAVTLDALEGRTAALMGNHGAIVHAASVEQAVERSLLLEWLCTVYWRAAAIGSPRRYNEPIPNPEGPA